MKTASNSKLAEGDSLPEYRQWLTCVDDVVEVLPPQVNGNCSYFFTRLSDECQVKSNPYHFGGGLGLIREERLNTRSFRIHIKNLLLRKYSIS